METVRLIFDVPSHIESEFGKCANYILSEFDQLLLDDIISQDEKNRIRKVILSNLNNLKRNFLMLVEAIEHKKKNDYI